MAVSAADKPIYVPQIRPQVSDPTSELARMVDWSAREFDNVSRGLVGGVPRWNLQTINAPPSRPRTGDIEYADGVTWNPGYGEGLYVYKGGVWVPFGIGAGGRLRLNAATNFYVDTGAGNNSNPGTSALPWLSSAPLWQRYDFGAQTVTLNLKNNSTAQIGAQPWVGGGALIVDLGAKSITTSGTTGDALLVTGSLPGTVTVQNGTLAATGVDSAGRAVCGLTHRGLGTVQYGGMTFGACADAHLFAANAGATLQMVGNDTFSGDAQRHYKVINGSVITNASLGRVISSGARAFQQFVFALSAFCDFASLGGSPWSFGTTPTGNQYNIVRTSAPGIDNIPMSTTGNSSQF